MRIDWHPAHHRAASSSTVSPRGVRSATQVHVLRTIVGALVFIHPMTWHVASTRPRRSTRAQVDRSTAGRTQSTTVAAAAAAEAEQSEALPHRRVRW